MMVSEDEGIPDQGQTNQSFNWQAALEQLDDLSPAAIDVLPFGVIQLDGAGKVVLYSAAESRFSGRAVDAVVGRDFFHDVAPCTDLPAFHGRFLEGVRRGTLDERFNFTFGFEPRPVRVEVRLRRAREPDRYWIAVRALGTLAPSRHRLAEDAASDAVTRRVKAEPVDPSSCEREPIHLAGAVQPHAMMLACDPTTPNLVVRACSDNVSETLREGSPAGIIGRSLAEFLPDNIVTAIRGSLAHGTLADPARPLRMIMKQGTGAVSFLVLVHLHDGRLVLELERLPERPEDFRGATAMQVQDAVARLRTADTLADTATTAAHEVQIITGFERVLVYRFDADWNGEAVAEAKVPDWEHSLLGLRFPASDIPAQARALYARAPARFVVDRDAVPAAVVTTSQKANEAVDLSFAQSRALSPVHLEYQRNLGVNGSMSLSILVEGRLWGLLIGHHRKPHYVTPDTRALASIVTDAFALRVHELESMRLWHDQQASLRARNTLLARMAASDDFVTALTAGNQQDGTTLRDVFAANGAAVVGHGLVETVGVTPPLTALLAMFEWLRRDLPAGQQVFATDRLSGHYAPAEAWQVEASGLLAVFIDEDKAGAGRDHLLLWFRPETASTVVWGGDPTKPVLADTATRTVLPRRSFERWVEERRGYAEPWAAWQVGTAAALASVIAGVILRQGRRIAELTVKQHELTRALDQKEVLAREVDHRVKNSLQIVAGVMLMQSRGVMDPQAKAAFQDTYARVMSVARVHDSLQQSDDVESVDLGETLRRLCEDLAASMTGAEQRLDISAEPGLMVSSQTAVALSLVATELVTNALKYAYAPGEPGRVEVSVNARPTGGIVLRVCDFGRGLSPDWASRPQRSGGGLGMRVIRAMLDRIGAEMQVEDARRPGTCFKVQA
ncbi:histidine kinase dimerization/phosphoacceptor domain -containing protein [Paracraurococcus lichenis]|uniref:histidine kinase n=1 Tax=Paracraurococcus lichenis TaxID=3064888 RepID=A0ABT9ECI7_9PROT|nr:histidine kinase dimerization/phosphoacceptor domain -containing protein [Paracraurococcus sp. LOR1-02]MDO9713926.1 histidine kinase dimerization/phosphoacceptor domain -containing protein [Paracraurococcus sp. LOR1-02]